MEGFQIEVQVTCNDLLSTRGVLSSIESGLSITFRAQSSEVRDLQGPATAGEVVPTFRSNDFGNTRLFLGLEAGRSFLLCTAGLPWMSSWDGRSCRGFADDHGALSGGRLISQMALGVELSGCWMGG